MMSKIANFHSKIPGWMKSGIFLGLFTFTLWVVSAAFSFYVLAEFQHMILRRYAICCSADRWGFQVLRQWTTIFMIGFWLAFTIISGEFHYQHFRQDVSWRVFKWSFLILFCILAVALIL
jgi:hypothetical protein